MSYMNKPVEAHAVVGQPQACRMTRSELMKTLADSGFGERDAMYHAYFHRAADGSALCNTCGLQIGHHADHSDAVVVAPAVVGTSTAAPHSPQEVDDVAFPPPNRTIQQHLGECQSDVLGARTAYPLHWTGASYWYAPLIEYVGRSREEESTVAAARLGRQKHSTRVRTITHARLQYRCAMSGCDAVFEIEGPQLDSTGAAVGRVSLKTMGNAESIEVHMERVHGLKHLPAGRIATKLFDCCKDPAVAMTCCCPFISFPCGFRRDIGLAPHAAIARVLEPGLGHGLGGLFAFGGNFFASSAPLDEVQCHPGLFANVILILLLPHAALGVAVGLVGSFVTLFGFPCNSDSLPPLLCFLCYKHRRQLIKVLDADETPFQSRVKATFCFYCSEVQVWRELKASGVWPGLLCCTASEEDREYMSSSAVRQRYSVDGAYAVRATSAEGERLLPAALKRLSGPSPKLCYGMK
jgi:hypothetical protein